MTTLRKGRTGLSNQTANRSKARRAKHGPRLLTLLLAGGAMAAGGYPSAVAAAPVEYVKVCSAFGAGFYYIPGTDKCANSNGMPYSVLDSNGTITTAPGTNATAYGVHSFAYGDESLAIGNEAWAGGDPTSASPGPGPNGYNGMDAGSAFFNSGTTAIGANAQAGAGADGQTNATAVGESAMANAAGASAFGQGSNASGANSTAIGYGASATQTGAVAIGAGAQATADPTTAVGTGAVASGNNATALGANSTASGANSVALGQGSVADQSNTVSVGSAGSPRRITNIAPGTGPSDAVNYTQLQDVYSRIATLGPQLSDKIGVTQTGVAMALAMGGAGGLQQNEHFAVSANWGTFEGANAGGVTLAARIDDHTSLNAGVGFGSGTVGARAGLRFGW